MTHDDLALHLDNLQRDDCYHVSEVLKESSHERTERVYFIGSNGAKQGPYIRKCLSGETGLGQAYELLFQAWQAGRRFKHLPIIFDCYSVGTDLVVIMENVAGETLQDIVYRCDPSPALTCDLFPRICDAVIELHTSFEAPLVHRDLKPSNIMISKESLTLIDFGIARSYKQEEAQDTNHFGTRDYAPPEQFGFGQTDQRSDVYALGMLLYYCLTEKTPTLRVREKGFTESAIPKEFRIVLVTATQLDPRDRYQTVQEMKDAFATIFSRSQTIDQKHSRDKNATIVAKPISASEVSKASRTGRNAVVLGVFILFLIASIGLIFDPQPQQAYAYDMSFEKRAMVFSALMLLFFGPIVYLLLDKRALKARWPLFDKISPFKQKVICIVLIVIGCLVIGLADKY